jgi:hypothetical protein
MLYDSITQELFAGSFGSFCAVAARQRRPAGMPFWTTKAKNHAIPTRSLPQRNAKNTERRTYVVFSGSSLFSVEY